MAEKRIEGIYYEETILGGGVRRRIRYWAREESGGSVVIESLKPDGTSSGMAVERLTREAFEKRFTEEAAAPQSGPWKSAQEILCQQHVDDGYSHLERKEFHSAEHAFKAALGMDSGHVEAGFGLGESFVGQGKIEEARRTFSRLADNDRLYTKEHKHTFNRLGISLRKQGMYAQAVKNYERAIRVDHQDPVLFFNLARALYEMNERERAVRFLENALALDPSFEQAARLLDFMKQEK